jgi:hypothetical protein
VHFLAFLPLLAPDLPTIAEKTKELTRREGLLPSYVDAKGGSVYLEFKPDANGNAGEFLYHESLKTGLGSNELGLDRGEPGETYVVRFVQRGAKVLMEAQNTTFRASSGDSEEVKSVRESFPSSVLFSFPLAARNIDGKILVDATGFVVRDAHGAARALQSHLDADRSALEPAACKAFPLNLEFESRLTFVPNGEPLPQAAAVSPDGRSVTIVEHQSLVKLPELGYKPRAFDPRGGAFGQDYYDFSAPLGTPLRKTAAIRFRLDKDHPIVYYVERGAPEPIRSALIEGASWWSKAFADAGFPGGFTVKLLPEGVDADDARYNVIQWVHRDTRGYSIGNAVVDPRTGEIIQGRVTLDSSRGRQDVLLFEGLLGTASTGKGTPDDPAQLALARIRQLAAHEVGHTLGFAHNFAGSTNDRSSVMDYPAPRIRLRGNALDVSDAYAKGIGAWDAAAVKYLYADAAPPKDLRFLTDQDADERSGAEPRATRFDNDDDPVAYLKEALSIRKLALSRFGEENLHVGQPTGELQLVLGPVYFYHRYAANSAIESIGGFHYANAVRGDGSAPYQPIDGAKQLAALEGLLDAIQPDVLDLPISLLSRLGPRSFGQPSSLEEFGSNTRFAFDGLGVANTAADYVVAGLLNPVRCQRVLELSTRTPGLPTLEVVLERLVARTFWVPASISPRQKEIRQGVQDVVLERLMDLSDNSTPAVRTRANATLRAILARLSSGTPRSDELNARITRFLTRPETAPKRVPTALPALPGAPIG